MLAWIETHLVKAVALAAAGLFLLYELAALLVAYSGDARVVAALIAVAPEVAGPIAELPVRIDQRVAAGDTLFVVDREPFAIAAAAAEASLTVATEQHRLAALSVTEAQADVEQAQATVTDAEAILERQRSLLRSGDAPVQRVDDAERDAVVARAALRRAQAAAAVAEELVRVRLAEVSAAAAALARARYDLERATVRAPIAGRIAPFEARIGDRVAIGQAVLLLVTDADWRVVANLAERHMARLAPGQTVLVTLGSDPWRIHRGEVRSLATAVASAPRPGEAAIVPVVPPDTDWIRLPQRFPVEIVLPGVSGQALFHGATARVLVLF